MMMTGTLQKNLAQLQIAALAQLGEIDLVRFSLPQRMVSCIDAMKGVPRDILLAGAVQLSDHPATRTAIRSQTFDAKSWLKWLMSVDGGRQVFTQVRGGKKSLKAGDDMQQQHAQLREQARASMDAMVKDIRESISRLKISRTYFETACDRSKKPTRDSYSGLVKEASNLSEVQDKYALSVSFYLKNRNTVARLGYDVGSFDKMVREAVHDETQPTIAKAIRVRTTRRAN